MSKKAAHGENYVNPLKFVVSHTAKHIYFITEKNLSMKITIVLSLQTTYVNLTVSISCKFFTHTICKYFAATKTCRSPIFED